jgi:A/G-specific adenine glycosylase
VLARLFRIDTPVGESATTERLWEEAGRFVPGKRPGALNQALMELGATVCTPKQPSCSVCPVSSDCAALAHGDVAALPVARARKAPRQVELTAVIATRGRGAKKSVWLVKGEQALFGGLWGVPMSEGPAHGALREAGLRARLHPERHALIEHTLTHRRLRVEVFRASAARGSDTPSRRLFHPEALAGVGVSSLTRKILRTADL